MANPKCLQFFDNCFFFFCFKHLYSHSSAHSCFQAAWNEVLVSQGRRSLSASVICVPLHQIAVFFHCPSRKAEIRGSAGMLYVLLPERK